MTVQMMDTLAQVLKDAEATPDERAVLIAAVQDLDDLDELHGDALRLYLDLRARMAEGATRLPRLAAALLAAGRPASAAVIDGFDHGSCTLTFCRNGTAPGEKPIHPGPCRGWRDHLRRNAPGVARALDRVDADRRKAREAARANAQLPPGVNVSQARALDTIDRHGPGGQHPRGMSPQRRKTLTDAGLITTGERQGADGKMHPTLVLTPKGQAIVDARKAARAEADRRIEERAVAEGLDPKAARLLGLPGARRERKQREEAEVRARRNEAERGAPPAPGDTAHPASPSYDNGQDRYAKALSIRARLQADLIKAVGGIGNVTPEQRQQLSDTYKRYVDSYSEIAGHREHVKAWADRLAYLSDSRDLQADPAVQADMDRLINEAKAGYDKAVTDLSAADMRAREAREAAGQAVVSVYAAHGKRKSMAALKLPETADATPPETRVRLAAEVSQVVRQAGGEQLPEDAPERAALAKAAGARIRQEREIAELKRQQEKNSRDWENARRYGGVGDAQRKVFQDESSRLSKASWEATQRLQGHQEAERAAASQVRSYNAAREQERITAEREKFNRPEYRAREALIRTEGNEYGRGRGYALRLEGGEDPRIVAGDVRRRIAALEAFRQSERWQQLGPQPRREVIRSIGQYREAVRQIDRMPAPPGNPALDPLDRIVGDDEAPLAANIRARIERGDDRAGLIAELRARAKEMDSISRRTKTVGVEERNAATRNRGIYMGIIKELERGGVSASALAIQLAGDLAHGRCTWDFCLAGTAPGEPKIHPGPCRGGRANAIKARPAGTRTVPAAEPDRPPTRSERAAQVAAMPEEEWRPLLAELRPDLVDDGSIEVVSRETAAGIIARAEERKGLVRPDVDRAEEAREARLKANRERNQEALDDYLDGDIPTWSGGRRDLPPGVRMVPVAELRSTVRYSPDGFDFSRQSEWDRLQARQMEMDHTARFFDDIQRSGMQPIQLSPEGDEVLNGHHRLAMALLMGARAIPVSDRDYESWGEEGGRAPGSGRNMFAVMLAPERAAPSALVASLTSLARLHWDCTDTFCRNGTMPGEKKVHPGPCRGWKEALRKVAPGALEIIEAERRRKLAERKAGRPPAKKAARRARPKPPPEPEPQRLVRLSPETLRLADEVARELPRDEAGWHAMVNRREVGGRRAIEMEMDNLRERMERERPNYDKALEAARAQVRRQRPPAERRRRTLTEQEERDAREAVRFDRRLGGVDYVRAEARLREVEAIEAAIQRKLAAGEPLDYGEQYMNNPGPSIIRGEYPIDPNGVRLPPEPLRHAEERVRQMGRALHQDIRDALADHPDVRTAQAAYDAANEEYRRTRSFESRQRLVATDQALTRTTNQTRRAMVLDALSQIRPMGGQRHTDLDVVQGSNDADRDNGRADWRERMAVGDQHFPDDWVAASSRARLTVASSNRAWHRASGGGWEETTDPAQRYSMLAMTSEHEERRARGTRDRPAAPYGGGFADRVDETTVHELGHRMEQQIPGLQALEFAWLRAHTTQGGTVERQVSLRDVAHSGYGAHEVAYRDSFNNAYTGRTYERGPADPDPAARAWEVFQVGLQQTFGSESRFGPNSLADFTLGALATLGRTDLD